MDGGVDETYHVVSLCKFENTSTNKKYKEQILKENVIPAICAMLNSNGGKVILHIDTNSKESKDIPDKRSLSSQVSLVVRILEQSLIAIIGPHLTVSNINFKDVQESIVIFVNNTDSLITTNYSLFLPSETQIVQVSPWESLEKAKNTIIHRKVVPQAVLLDSHRKIFCKGKDCGFQENKNVAVKNLKADQSKRTRLADRMTGKGNKFICYVSAFANYNGGHIYYGIAHDGVVEGELIPNEEDKREISKKVEKTINKMIWPEQIGQPKRGEHWEIFFEPVVDENHNAIPSTFVIVIYIAPCLGGVFTEEPECYEMVEGKVEKMSFTTWKKRIWGPVWLHSKEEIPHAVQRITWSSAEARKAFTIGNNVLMEIINNGNWDAISREGKSLQRRFQFYEMKLLVLSRQVTACSRRGHFNEARVLLEQYTAILPHAKDKMYLQVALKRASGDFKKLEELLAEALSKAELIEPGLVTATVYIFAATVTDLINSEDPTEKIFFSPDVLSIRGLEHLRCVAASSEVFADIKKKIHITLATFYLGCNISGQRINDISGLDKAKTSIMAVHQSVYEGNPLSRYHEVQFKLVQSIYYYRYSQVNTDERTRLLRNAFNYAQTAKSLAKDNQFTEMVEWSKANEALCTEELLRTHCFSARKSIQPENS